MFKNYIIFFLVFIIVTGCSPKIPKTIQVKTKYQDGQTREVYNVLKNNKDCMQGKYISYYKNGNKESEGEYHSNTKIGGWIYFYENGFKKLQLIFNEKSIPIGEKKEWYENGKMNFLMEFNYKGLPTGKYIYYNDVGGIISKGNCKNGKRMNGTFPEFGDSQGNYIGISTYKDGLLNGKAYFWHPKTKQIVKEEYYENGVLKKEVLYGNILWSAGRRIDLGKYYFEDGQWINGLKEGIWSYNINGKEIKIDYSKGKKNDKIEIKSFRPDFCSFEIKDAIDGGGAQTPANDN